MRETGKRKGKKYSIQEIQTHFGKLIVDCSELDSVIEKAERLDLLLKEVRTLQKELTSLRKRKIKILIKDVWDCDQNN